MRKATTLLLFGFALELSFGAACSKSDGSSSDPVDASTASDGSAADAAASDAAAAEADAASVDADEADAIVDAVPPDAAPAEDLSIVLTGSTATVIAGHIYSGSQSAVDECPEGYVLTGLRGRLRVAYNGPIQGVCRALVLTQGPLAVTTTGALVELPPHGDAFDDDIVWSRDCPEGQMIAGVEGRAGAIIDRLVFRCVPLAVTADAPYVTTTGQVTLLDPVGGIGGSAFTPAICGAGQVARGLATYFNGDPGFGLGMIYLDGAGLVCATPGVQPAVPPAARE
jgi:hypothetical protein